VAELDGRLWRAVAAELATPALIDRLVQLDARRSVAHVSKPAAARAAAERTLARLARVEPAILARYRRGEIEEEALDSELLALRQERAAATASLAAAARDDQVVDLSGRRRRSREDLLRELGRAVELATAEERRRILQMLVAPASAILQGGGGLEISLRIDLAPGAARSAMDSDCSFQRENVIEIRVIA
jgi:hypothetical protein